MINLDARTRYHAQVFKALGHPHRLHMMDLLAHGSMITSEFSELLGARVSTYSRHLAVLGAVGLVRSGRTANAVSHQRETDLVARFQQMLIDWQSEIEKKCDRRCAYY